MSPARNFFLAICFCLAACGGGGSSSDDGQISRLKRDMPHISFGRNPASPGYASATRALRQSLASETFIKLSADERKFVLETANENIIKDAHPLAFQPIKDTNAETAWRMGWTGRGVKVGILDDFTNVGRGGQTHGGTVAAVALQVAPEMRLARRQLTFGCNRPAGLNDNEIKNAFTSFEANGYHIVNNSWSVDRYWSDSCAETPNPRLLDASDWNDSINLEKEDATSKGMIIPITDDDAYNANMLFIFAAGNNGQECPGGISECNLLAAAIDSMRQDDDVSNAGERVLFVGALSDLSAVSQITRIPKSLASYSHPAGDMMNDYIVAHDDINYYQDASGTSFAAPRVAGAAALIKHKFPSLNGPRLKQVLLQSADDLGDPGPDRVFGAGQLNIVNALSPIDGLTR